MSNPFTPMNKARPDRTSDGLKNVMIDISKDYNSVASDFIHYSHLVRSSSMHRLTLDKYLDLAVEKGLIKIEQVPGGKLIGLMNDGRKYIFGHKIVKE